MIGLRRLWTRGRKLGHWAYAAVKVLEACTGGVAEEIVQLALLVGELGELRTVCADTRER